MTKMGSDRTSRSFVLQSKRVRSFVLFYGLYSSLTPVVVLDLSKSVTSKIRFQSSYVKISLFTPL